MDRISFKSKFMLFGKKFNSNEQKNTFLSTSLSRVNQNSLWLQSMEPIKYAKNYAEKLYEIDKFKIEKVEVDLFKKELFINLWRRITL